jgi:hypothetical protein
VPSITSIIDTVATPPLASLQQVLDTGGPYGPGSYKLTTFTTNGAFLLPAGTYGISGTYGVIAQVNGIIPPNAGFDVGWVDPGGIIFASGEVWEPLIGQVNLIHFLPITGAGIITESHDLHRLQETFLWPALLGSAANVGLYVAPNWHVDLYYMCVL